VTDVEVVLDLSRLLSRVRHATPTGIDRVEMAYARMLPHRFEAFGFAGVHPVTRRYGRLSGTSVDRFLDFTQSRWDQGGPTDIAAIGRHMMMTPSPPPPRSGNRPRVLIQASPSTLDRPTAFAQIIKREDAAFVPLIHDLIPITHPEFARPGGDEKHRRRLTTLTRFARGVIANSQATLDAARPYLAPGVPTCVALLGVDASPVPLRPAIEPYFVCVATIEPRKNHLLLLNIWRRLSERGGPVPRLVLIGRRGWENENVIDLLDRCPAIRTHVVEEGRVSDDRLHALLGGARALLMPSFAEGFGLPVAEALAAGVAVVCSDLPALREAGGDVPDYLDPLDGLGWLQAVDDFRFRLAAGGLGGTFQ
jgi:glycosyltransferase involved in cell wall biosynthesis